MPTTLHSAQAAARWLGARVQGALRTDSRALQPGDGFIAWPGYATDARRYVRGALQAGAAACLVEHEGVAAFDLPNDERVASLSGLKAATGEVAAIFYGRPGVAMNVLAVTGTNGKSSTAWWTAQALTSLGRRCGLVGTLGIGEPPRAGVAAAAPSADALAVVGGVPWRVGHAVSAAALGDDGLAAMADIGLMSQATSGAAELTHPPGRLGASAGIRATGLTTPDPQRRRGFVHRLRAASVRAGSRRWRTAR